jgi:hypothetical protein
MKKFTYWVSICSDDSSCYFVRAKTKKACLEMIKLVGRPEAYEAPKKVTVHFIDTFDLVDTLLGQCSNGHEYKTEEK